MRDDIAIGVENDIEAGTVDIVMESSEASMAACLPLIEAIKFANAVLTAVLAHEEKPETPVENSPAALERN